MKTLVSGLAGLAALGFGALAAQPAEAQPYYPGYGYRRPPLEYGHRPVIYPRAYPAYRSAYRPVGFYGAYRGGPRCFTRMDRTWDGYGWARRPVRICR